MNRDDDDLIYPCPCGCEVMLYADPDAIGGRRAIDLEALSCLARNIRDAAIGCESFYRGTALGVEIAQDPYRASRGWGWEPGNTLPASKGEE